MVLGILAQLWVGDFTSLHTLQERAVEEDWQDVAE